MFKQIAPLSALFVQTLAWGYNVNVQFSWIDQTLEYTNPYVEKVGLDKPGAQIIPVEDGETAVFRALVPTGHEVTKWSYTSDSSVLYELGNGAFKNEQLPTNPDTFSFSSRPNSDVALAVHLDWLKYNLAYDGNGATSGSAPTLTDLIYTNKVTLAANPFSKTGYSFKNWQMKESPDRTFVDQAKVTGESFGLSYTNKSVTLVAQWTPNQYIVTFDANGGQFSTGSSQPQTKTVTYDTAYGDLPTGLTRGGYTFANSWTNSAGQTIGPDSLVKTASNHTLYAKWNSVGNLRIETIKHPEETGADGSTSGTGSYAWGSTCHLQATPNTGSHFVKWTKNAEGGPVVSTDAVYELVVTESATYYAHFALDEYTVQFKYKDAAGNDVSTNEVVKYGQAATPPTVPDYPHNKFNKWDTSDYKSVKGNLTVNAEYVSTVLTVRFDPNGGDPVSPEELQYDIGDVYSGLPTPTRTGYTWDGKWWTRTSGGEPITKDSTVSAAGNQTLYPHWTASQYTVTLDPNDEGVSQPTTKTVTYDAYYPSLPEVERTGYTFGGWFTGRTGGEKVTTSVKVTTADDHTLYAHWTAKESWVYLDAKGGSGAPSSIQVTYDEPYAGLTSPTREGYEFLGWFTDATGGTQIQNGERVQITTTTYLYAHWKVNEYTVTFDPKGGSVGETSRKVAYDSAYGELPTPTRTGYDFEGWYTVENTRVYASTTFRQTNDITLEAHWTAHKFTVNFNSNGGTGWMSNQDFTWDTPKQLTPCEFTRTGYGFAGWAKSAQAEVVEYTDGLWVSNLTTSTSIQLFAVWTPNEYTISFNANGGSGGPMTDIKTKYGTAVTLPPNAYSNGIRAFSSWKGSDNRKFADGEVVSNLTSTANATYVLTAQWGTTYQIAFDGNDATEGTMDPLTVEASETVALTSNRFVRTGYTFLGWATNVDEAAAWRMTYADGQTVKSIASVGEVKTLFAVWTNNPYRVRFYPNGGAGNPFERSFAYDVAQNLPGEDVFTRDGYELVGWLTDPTNAVAFTAGESAVNLSDEAGAVVPLFAKWKSLGEDLGPYSEAADCAIATSDRDALRLTAGSYCTTVTNVTTAPGANDQCICLCPTVNGMTTAELRSIVLRGYGKFSFDYKAVIRYGGEDPEVSNFTCGIEEGGQDESLVDLKSSSDGWKHVEYDKRTEGDATVEWIFKTFYNDEDSDMVFIDNVAWLPEDRNLGTAAVTFRLNDGTAVPADIWSNATFAVGKAIGALPVLPDEGFVGWSTNGVKSGKIDANWIVPVEDTQLCALWDSGEYPVPGPEDAPAIGGFAPTAGGFSLSFPSDDRFDYRVLSTTSLVASIVWEPDAKMRLEGTGGTLTFQIPVGEGTDPARFFKVEVLPREAK